MHNVGRGLFLLLHAGKMLRSVLFASCVTWLLQASLAAQCLPEPVKPCVTHCNGTTFDISNVFQYPVNITNKDRGFYFLWDPCNGLECPDFNEPKQKSDCAICQKADFYYNCGHLTDPIFLLDQYDPFLFKILYPWGTTWRISQFTFIVDKTLDTPTVEFIGEVNLQYNFVVRGKCIGQPYCN